MRRSSLIPGLVLVGLGTVFLLDALDVLSAGAIIAGWWPTVIIVAGLATLLSRPADLAGGTITTAIGLILLGVTLGYLTTAVIATLWPLALIGVGVWLLLARRDRPSGETPDDSVSAVAVFSGRELTPTSRRFAGGSVFAAFGGVEIDLRAALPDPEGCRIDVTVMFGGCDIVVPPGWRVSTTGPAIFGGIDNHTADGLLPEAAPRVDVRVLALFGGVDAKLGPALSVS